MEIDWFKESRPGTASLYPTNITLNAEASFFFKKAYRVMVGKKESFLALRPISKDEADRWDLDEDLLYKINVHQSYARISSTPLMKQISEALGLEIGDGPCKYRAFYDEESGMLLVDLSKEVV